MNPQRRFAPWWVDVRIRRRRSFAVAAVFAFALGLTACAGGQGLSSFGGKDDGRELAEWLDFANDGVSFLEEGAVDEASDSFNDALKLNIRNAQLQALNGIAYHLSARDRDAMNFSLAEEGYKLAVKFNPSNWRFHYLLGLIYYEQGKYALARKHLIKAAVRNSGSVKVFQLLLAAAYSSLDFELARGVAEYMLTRELSDQNRIETLKSCALSNAALQREARASQCYESYASLTASRPARNEVAERMAVWGRLHDAAATLSEGGGGELAQSDDEYDENEDDNEENVISDEKMVVVDVVIIGSRQDNRKHSGINILNGLEFQFGDSADGTDAFNYSKSASRDMDDATNNATVKSVVRTLTIPAISYSLNIVNSADNQSKILAKPSLMALSGETSTFFSGVNITGAATSGGTGDSVSIEKEIGVKLEVTPEFLGGGKIRLAVKATRTFLTDPSSSVVFDYRIDTTKTEVDSKVVLNVGETLLLGGLIEQEDANGVDGVPGLREVPGLRMLFSETIERRYKKSITILLTPRTPADEPSPTMPEAAAQFKNADALMLRRLIGRETAIEPVQDDGRNTTIAQMFGRDYLSDADVSAGVDNAEIVSVAQSILREMKDIR